MSDKKELSRAELVRLRREQEHANHMNRIVKEATRPVPVARVKKAVVVPKKKKPVQNNARRRFQIALAATPRADTRSVSIPRPRLGWRLFSFILSVVFGTVLYFAFNLSQLRVTEAQVTGNQIVTPADVNSVLNISGQPVFLLTPSDLETRQGDVVALSDMAGVITLMALVLENIRNHSDAATRTQVRIICG